MAVHTASKETWSAIDDVAEIPDEDAGLSKEEGNRRSNDATQRGGQNFRAHRRGAADIRSAEVYGVEILDGGFDLGQLDGEDWWVGSETV